MADGRHFKKIEKSPNLCNALTDWYKIWHVDTHCLSELDWALKFRNFKNPRWRKAAIRKNWKTAITGQ